MPRRRDLLFLFVALAAAAHAFLGGPTHTAKLPLRSFAEPDADDVSETLTEKMASWEATEEEVKAATLGGLTPTSSGSGDAFDIGLWLAFPPLFLSLMLFLLFPFLRDNVIDLGDLPPPQA